MVSFPLQTWQKLSKQADSVKPKTKSQCHTSGLIVHDKYRKLQLKFVGAFIHNYMCGCTTCPTCSCSDVHSCIPICTNLDKTLRNFFQYILKTTTPSFKITTLAGRYWIATGNGTCVQTPCLLKRSWLWPLQAASVMPC